MSSLRTTSDWAHLVAHLASKSEHLLQGRGHRGLRYAGTSPLRAIYHGDHILRFVILLHREYLLRQSMNICGLAEAGEVRTYLYL